MRKAVIANKIFPVLPAQRSRTRASSSSSMPSSTISRLRSTSLRSRASIRTRARKSMRHASDDKEPFCALAFKLQARPVRRAADLLPRLLRHYRSRYLYLQFHHGNKERLGRIVRLQADKREEVKKVFAGEIAAAVGLKDAKTSHTFCDENIRSSSTRSSSHGAGYLAPHRAEDQGRPGEDGYGTQAPLRRRSDLPHKSMLRQARRSSWAWASSTSRLSLTA
jgi:translation elongation factor EF-G